MSYTCDEDLRREGYARCMADREKAMPGDVLLSRAFRAGMGEAEKLRAQVAALRRSVIRECASALCEWCGEGNPAKYDEATLLWFHAETECRASAVLGLLAGTAAPDKVGEIAGMSVYSDASVPEGEIHIKGARLSDLSAPQPPAPPRSDVREALESLAIDIENDSVEGDEHLACWVDRLRAALASLAADADTEDDDLLDEDSPVVYRGWQPDGGVLVAEKRIVDALEAKDAEIAALRSRAEDEEKACTDLIKERDGWEAWCTEVAQRLGCGEGWSSAHDHRLCVFDNIGELQARAEHAEKRVKDLKEETDRATDRQIEVVRRKNQEAADAHDREVRLRERLKDLQARAERAEERVAVLEEGLRDVLHSMIVDCGVMTPGIKELRALLAEHASVGAEAGGGREPNAVSGAPVPSEQEEE